MGVRSWRQRRQRARREDGTWVDGRWYSSLGKARWDSDADPSNAGAARGSGPSHAALLARTRAEPEPPQPPLYSGPAAHGEVCHVQDVIGREHARKLLVRDVVVAVDIH